MEDFNLNNLEIDFDNLEMEDMFEVSDVVDDEVIEVPHIRLHTKDFLNALKRAKTVISSSAKDLMSKSVCMQVIGNELYVNATNFDVFIEAKAPIINTENILEKTIVCPINTLFQLAKAFPSTVTLLEEDGKVKVRLIGGSIDIETIEVARDKFLMHDEVAPCGEIDAQEFNSILNALASISQNAISPSEKRIIFNQNGAMASYMFTIACKEGNYPEFDVKMKDLGVLRSLTASQQGKLRTYKVVDEKASSRFVIEHETFKYTFLVGECSFNRMLVNAYKKSDFDNGGYIEFNNIYKLVELSSMLNYSAGKILMKFTDMNNLELILPTKNGNNIFNLEVTSKGNIVQDMQLEVPAKMFYAMLKVFQKNMMLVMNIQEDRLILSNDDFKGIILLDA